MFGIPAGLYLFRAELVGSVLIGALVFLIPQIYFIHKHSSKVASTVDSVKISNETLNKVDKGYNELKKDPQDKFFVEWYADEFKVLDEKMTGTSNLKYITCTARRLKENDNPIYNVFNKKDCNFFYATCTCEGIKWWLNPPGKDFISNIHQKVKEEKITNIRRIFIFDQESDFIIDSKGNKQFKPLIQFCLALHQKDKYEFKLIEKKIYDDRFKEETKGKNRVEPDFGIYGGNYVWETIEAYKGGMLTRGSFSKETNKLLFYIKFFDKLWKDDEHETTNPAPFMNADITGRCKADDSITKLSTLYREYNIEMAKLKPEYVSYAGDY
ncbi:MAG: hypothetical protein FWG55_01320 [Candidatus Bathyarchaeota archaeon]|nr:hypothetical protein [Candidatus Termiticorpusculum sp.]